MTETAGTAEATRAGETPGTRQGSGAAEVSRAGKAEAGALRAAGAAQVAGPPGASGAGRAPAMAGDSDPSQPLGAEPSAEATRTADGTQAADGTRVVAGAVQAPEALDGEESDAQRRRRRAQFLRDLAEARELRDRVQPRRAKAARLRHAMRMRTFRW
ncbi:response regulator [Streptomyces sp. 16-176A]